jgi:hypothetical protein
MKGLSDVVGKANSLHICVMLFTVKTYLRLTHRLNRIQTTQPLIRTLLLLSRSRLCHYSVGGARWHLCFYESF